MYRKILVATDGSEHARRAVERAACLARYTQGQVTLVTVLRLPTSYLLALGSSIGMGSEPWAALQRASERILEADLIFLLKQGITAAREMKVGNPAHEVLRLAREGRFDLIIVGRRGRGLTESYFLGSVSDRISHEAPCDVLIVQ
ncbi:MAG: universal stress protein [Deltaproteobacteria bacterium]|nr:universal stress protein [Deltaproteobacteria bacterium]MBW1953210.1 universal stress protein [Deltaproteobacteria bacterium]MBW1985669.1 universal stress protein [Deltaproteobacteria bacterium]MBW2134582.1 universal stress protein [Deltaproteobacteria bacterium]